MNNKQCGYLYRTSHLRSCIVNQLDEESNQDTELMESVVWPRVGKDGTESQEVTGSRIASPRLLWVRQWWSAARWLWSLARWLLVVRKQRAGRSSSVELVAGTDGLTGATPMVGTALPPLLKGRHRNLRGTAGALAQPTQEPRPGGRLKHSVPVQRKAIKNRVSAFTGTFLGRMKFLSVRKVILHRQSRPVCEGFD